MLYLYAQHLMPVPHNTLSFQQLSNFYLPTVENIFNGRCNYLYEGKPHLLPVVSHLPNDPVFNHVELSENRLVTVFTE